MVRATGGLDDTIDVETGFKFWDYAGWALFGAIEDASAAYQDEHKWTAMMVEAMAKDFSWTASAQEYEAVYRRIFTH